MRKTNASAIALCGVLGALGVVIMCLGGIIPFAAFACPVLTMGVLLIVKQRCGKRLGWVWYCCVSILCALLCPDKEAAALFVFMGYYPLIKPWFDKKRFSAFWKFLYFVVTVSAMYGCLIYLLGMSAFAQEFAEAGFVLGAITAVLGVVTFFMVDRLLFVIRRRF